MQNAKDSNEGEEDGQRVDEDVVVTVVVLADAGAHPRTVVVKPFHTVPACVAMRGSWRSVNIAYYCVLSQFLTSLAEL